MVIRDMAVKLFGGLFFGIGLTAAVLVGWHMKTAVWEKPLPVSIVEKTDKTAPVGMADYKKNLVILSHMSYHEHRPNNQLHVLGKIKNNGFVAWKNIEIQAELFYKGQFVDECHNYIKTLMPSEEDNFKITCGDDKRDTLPEYDKIELKVSSARAD